MVNIIKRSKINQGWTLANLSFGYVNRKMQTEFEGWGRGDKPLPTRLALEQNPLINYEPRATDEPHQDIVFRTKYFLIW
jgi:hypothetical protein